MIEVIKFTKEFAEQYKGYRYGVCVFDYCIIGGNYYTGVAAINQFPTLDFTDFEIVTIASE